jgi:hypothetical protein
VGYFFHGFQKYFGHGAGHFRARVDPLPTRRLAEAQYPDRVWIVRFSVSSAPRLHNCLVRYDQQIASAELVSPSGEFAACLSADPRRTTSRF